MKKCYCDICGQEIKDFDPFMAFWKKDVFYDLDDEPIEDICPDCFYTLYACINMMKRVGWKPDFHEKLNSESIWDSDRAGYALSEIEDRTHIKFL